MHAAEGATGTAPGSGSEHVAEEAESLEDSTPSMAVSIAGVSTACSKKALASSAKAVRESLSSD